MSASSMLYYSAKIFATTLRWVLIIGLCAQSIIFFLFLNEIRYPLPQKIENHIREIFQKHGYTYTAQKSTIYSDLTIELDDWTLIPNELSQAVAHGKIVRIKPQIASLLLGQFTLKQLYIKEASYHPITNSDLYISELSADVRASGPWWNVRFLRAKINKHISFLTYGTLPRKKQDYTSLNATSDQPTTLATLEKFLHELPKTQSLYVTLSLTGKPIQAIGFTATIFGENLNFEKIQIDDFCINGRGIFADKKVMLDSPWKIIAANLTLRETPLTSFSKTKCAYGQIAFEEETKNPLAPTQINAYAYQTISPLGLLDSAYITLTSPLSDAYQGYAIATISNSWLWSKGSIEKKSLQSSLESKLYFEDTLISSLTPFAPFLQKFSKQPNLSASAFVELKDNAVIEKIDFTACIENGQWEKLFFSKVTATGQYTPEKLTINDYTADTPLIQAKGQAAIDFQGPCRFQVVATGAPSSLNDYLPGWWAPIWPPLVFNKQNPWTNLDIHANFKDEQAICVIGAIEGKEFFYKGVSIDRFHTRLYARYLDVTLGRFWIDIIPTKAEGSLRWIFDEDNEAPIATEIQYEGNLPLKAIAVLPPVDTIVKPFDCPIPPTLRLKGCQYLLTPEKNTLQIAADCSSPLRYLDIPLDSLHFKANEKGTFLTIDPIIFQISQGKGEASANVSPVGGEDPKLSFVLKIKGARRDELLADIPYLHRLKTTTPSPGSIQRSPSPGFIDFSLSADGPLNRPIELSGHGLVELKEAAIAINPSNPTEPFSIASFQVREAVAPFTLQNQSIRFEGARLSGPTSRIQANGNYSLATGQLNFHLQVFPFAEVPLLSTAFLPLRPFSKVFEIHLTGSLESPTWRFRNLSTR